MLAAVICTSCFPVAVAGWFWLTLAPDCTSAMALWVSVSTVAEAAKPVFWPSVRAWLQVLNRLLRPKLSFR